MLTVFHQRTGTGLLRWFERHMAWPSERMTCRRAVARGGAATSLRFGTFQLVQNRREGRDQERQVLVDGAPEYLGVDAEILMDQLVANPGH